jgi:predicted small secreted protein
MRVLSIVVAAFLTMMVSVSLSGCNTAKGFGQDMQAGGQEIQKAASSSKS